MTDACGVPLLCLCSITMPSLFLSVLFLSPAIQLGSFVAEQLTGRHQVVYIRDYFVSLRESAVFTAKSSNEWLSCHCL